MAARINTRFLLILFVFGATALIAVGGLWVIKKKGDTSKLIERGDAFMQTGDYRSARRFYGRAVGKQPANLEHLADLELALTSIEPETSDEARELYRAYISYLKHLADHFPADPERHIVLLEELHEATRRSNSWGYSELMAEAADVMLLRLPEGRPERIEALLYRGAAKLAPRMQERLPQEEVQQGEADLVEYVKAVPSSDIGWATLIRGRLAFVERLRTAGNATRAEEALATLRETVLEAREKVTDGPEVLVAALGVARFERRHGLITIDEETIRSDANAVVRQLQDQERPWLVSQSAEVIDSLRAIGDLPDAMAVVDGYLAAYPEAQDQRLVKATLHYYYGQLDEAEASIDEVLAAEPLTVSFLAQLQFELKRRASSLRVDVAARRWDTAEPDERAALVQEIDEARAALEAMVSDPDSDPFVTRARGKLAFARGEDSRAAALFNELVSKDEAVDFETMLYAAISLERLGEIGASDERIRQAIEKQPNNTSLLLHAAGLSSRMGRYEEAMATVSQVLELRPDDERALSLKEQLAPYVAAQKQDDPVILVLRDAQAAVEAGDHELARSTLLAARQQYGDQLRIINALILVETLAGETDAALEYVESGLAIDPGNTLFLSHRARLEEDNPIERVKAYVSQIYQGETEQTIEILHTLRDMRRRQAKEAERLEAEGKTDEADAARTLGDEAAREEQAYLVKAQRIAPENPRFIEYRFLDAVTSEDWDAAQAAVQDAVRLNSDEASGAMFQGRLAAAQGDFAASVVSFREAAERLPYSATAWRLTAIAYQRVGNLAEAAVAFARSYANNPNDIATVRGYSDVLTKTGNQIRALAILRDAQRLVRGNARLRELRLALEAEYGDAAAALRERRQIYADDPSDTLNAVALASFLGKTTPNRELLLKEDGTELYTLERWRRLPSRGPTSHENILAAAQQEWYAEADALVEAIAPADQRELPWHLLHADLLRARGEIDAAEAELAAYAELADDKLDAMIALGMFQTQVNRIDEAVSIFQEAMAYQSDESPRADLALAELYFNGGRYEDALPHFEKVNVAQPSPRIDERIIECFSQTGQFVKARARLESLQQTAGVNGTNLLLQASIVVGQADQLWNEGEKAEAERFYQEHGELLDRAQQLEPTNPLVFVLRASTLVKAYRRDGDVSHLTDALRELGKADELDASFPRTKMTRVAVLREQGNQRAAINELSALIELVPSQHEGRRLLIRLLLDEKRLDEAIASAEAAVEINPTSAFWLESLGDLYSIKFREVRGQLKATDPDSRIARDLKESMASLLVSIEDVYARTLEIAPTTNLVAKKAEVLLEKIPPDYRGAIEVIDQHPDGLEINPNLRLIYARALFNTGRREEAIDNLRVAYGMTRRVMEDRGMSPEAIANWYVGVRAVFPPEETADVEALAMEVTNGDLDAYELLALASLWRMRGEDGVSRTVELLRQAIDELPDDRRLELRIYRDLSMVLLATDQNAAAKVALERLLELDPENGSALNNLAFVLAEAMGEPAKALPYAKRAAAALPESWSVQDTLGWIHYRLGDDAAAEGALRRSELLEVTAVNQLHLAYLYWRRGDGERARKFLDQAAKLRPDPDTLREINELADDIRTKGGGRK